MQTLLTPWRSTRSRIFAAARGAATSTRDAAGRLSPLAFTVVAALLLQFQAGRSAESQLPPLQVELEFSEPLRFGVPNTLNARVHTSMDIASATPELVLPPEVEMTGGPVVPDVKLTRGVPATFAYLVTVTGEGDFAIAFGVEAGAMSARTEMRMRAAQGGVEITRPSAKIARDAGTLARSPGLLTFRSIAPDETLQPRGVGQTSVMALGLTDPASELENRTASLVDLGLVEAPLSRAARGGAERASLVDLERLGGAVARSNGPDLRCFHPDGWAGPIVASSLPGTHSDGPDLYEGEKTYVDWAIANYDNEEEYAEPFHVCLLMDGEAIEEWYVEGGLAGDHAIGVQDAEYYFPYGQHELRLEIDCEYDVDEWDEDNNYCYREYEWKRHENVYPDLACWQPEGWSGPIVASSVRNTHTDGPDLFEGMPTYVDWAVANYDDEYDAYAGPFYVCLKKDDHLLAEWYVDGGLAANHVIGVEDAEYMFPYGEWELGLEVDCHYDVEERYENNNRCYRVYEWKRGYPDLACWQPEGWSGPIVASSVPGTHTDGPDLREEAPTWVDWAIANHHDDYEGYAGPFYVCLTNNGQPLEEWYIDGGLSADHVIGVEDAQYRFPYGVHELGLEADCYRNVDEWYEDNNWCYR
jgi:hypothetical protein